MAEGWRPHPGPQEAFHESDAFELFYGGAAGGGKSESLLEEATRFISRAGYAAVLFRRSYPELTQQGGLIPRSHEKYPRYGGEYNATHRRWKFPSGATISFAHLHHDDDRYQYQGAAWHYIAFDELTHFPEEVYLYLFSRARTTIPDIPVRIRGASNPGNRGHEWVKKRFVVPLKPYEIKYFRSDGGTEVETDADDNPTLLSMDGSYLARLEALPLLERERLLRGDWDIMPAGNIFKREWFGKRVISAPDGLDWVRYWDLAASVKESADFTASGAVAESNGDLYIKDVIRGRWEWPDAKRLLKETMLGEDGTAQGIERAQHGLAAFQELMRDPDLLGTEIRSVVVDKDKLSRALPWSARAEAGKVVLVDGPWVDSFVNEVVAFSGDGKTHDDQVDAVSGAVQMVVDKRDRVLRIQNNPFR
jgi:predicted phage terminase large subunit-like protein